MNSDELSIGIDLGTSAVRIAIINIDFQLLYTDSAAYPHDLACSEDWITCCKELIINIPSTLKKRIKACSIDGTSGTLIACDNNGKPLGEALPYHLYCHEQEETLKQIFPNNKILSNSNNSIARAFRLMNKFGSNIIIRHQADWVSGWFINNWELGEEGNNIKLGWDIFSKSWPKEFENLLLKNTLPRIVSSGSKLDRISVEKSEILGLSKNLQIVAGTTDSNAAFIAAKPNDEDGVTVLGSTIVLKKYVHSPIKEIGISNHKVSSKWICGGASNAGGAILSKFFNNKELKELSQQMNPEKETGIKLLPLAFKGERFPINEPNLEPILEPRPVSDALYLQALFEGLARIERKGWEKLISLGVASPKKIITIGGGAKNLQWRKIRERIIGIPIKTCNLPPSIGVAIIAIKAHQTLKQ